MNKVLQPGEIMTVNYLTRDNFGMYSTVMPGARGPEIMGVNTLLSNDVYSKEGEYLGDIREFMMNMGTGHIAYVVLAFGGLWGMGGKFFAVPWAALSLDTVNQRFALNAPKAALKDAPGFDKSHWPSMADPIWASDVHRFYATTDALCGAKTCAE
ncbi:PRC-barrel domain-containing protein [Burkholderiaceae bacterium UC74_6]